MKRPRERQLLLARFARSVTPLMRRFAPPPGVPRCCRRYRICFYAARCKETRYAALALLSRRPMVSSLPSASTTSCPLRVAAS